MHEGNTMVNNKPKQHKSAGVNIGSASLVMVFVVLSLTVFAVLSLVSANNELRLSTKFSESVKNYYAADYKACTIIETMETKMDSETAIDLPEVLFEGSVGSFSVPINDYQNLCVKIDTKDNQLQILSWQVKNTMEQVYDNSIPVWTGDEGVFQ